MSKGPAPTLEESATRSARAREQLSSLARRIRALRERKALTQEDFAARCGISVSFASLLERGERSPSYETLVEVAQALEVSVSELFRDAPIEAYDDPYYARLLDLARKLRLSRGQVDRLVAVGQAMFGPDGEGGSDRGSVRRVVSLCTQDGCGRPLLAKGLCASHYHRERRARS